MKARVINPYAPKFGKIVDVDMVWVDSFQTTDVDEIQYGKEELEFLEQKTNSGLN